MAIPSVRHSGDVNALDVVHEALANSAVDYLLLCCAETWLGDLMPVMLNSLIDELTTTFTTWGICSHAGTRSDGAHSYQFTRRPPINPAHAVAPKVVITLGYGAMLINLRAFREHSIELPKLSSCRRPELVLGYLALEQGLPLLADRRLLTGFFAADGTSPMEIPSASEETKQFLGTRLVNHVLITPHDHVVLLEHVAFEALQLPRAPVERRDLFALFERSLKARRATPSISIICRTQLKRPTMLERTISSCAAGALEAADLINTRVLLVSDQEGSALSQERERLQRLAPALTIDAMAYTVRAPRSSRVDLVLQAIESAQDDFLWFVDDDDFIYPAAVRLLGSLLLAGRSTLVVGGAQHYEERWERSTDSAPTDPVHLVDSHPTTFVGAGGIRSSFDGENHVPICGLVFPRSVVRARIQELFALGDYLEDYFLLLRTLTAPSLEIEILHHAICGISNRGTENTGRSSDRSEWNRSYVTFFQELLLRAHDTSPAWWEIGHA